jgi:GNAT superfamily N-acetyltransferase
MAADDSTRDTSASASSVSVERFDAREWPSEQLEALFAEGFPAFITADMQAKRYVERVRRYFPDSNLMLVADSATPIATGWGVPIRWNGSSDDLPSGYTESLRWAVDLHEANGSPDTFVICGAVVHPGWKRLGLAEKLIAALCEVADRKACPRVIAPLRPTLKHRYPLTDIDEYASWTRDDGSPLDPWLRLHTKLGARVIGTAPTSQHMTGSVSEWETWAAMVLPATGEYVILGGLGPLHIDHNDDIGHYTEPNIWVQHR